MRDVEPCIDEWNGFSLRMANMPSFSLNRLETRYLPPSADFWDALVKLLNNERRRPSWWQPQGRDYSAIRVVVPTFEHAHLLQAALVRALGGDFIPPRISTLFALLELQAPNADAPRPAAASERLLSLFAALREHAWLKSLFGARSNADLLPLAQNLLSLSDELTTAFLPTDAKSREQATQRWQVALESLPAPVKNLVSKETQLVWGIWQSQLDSGDVVLQKMQKLMQIADTAVEPLLWISPNQPDRLEQAFLTHYREKFPVMAVHLDWQSASLPGLLVAAWPEVLERDTQTDQVDAPDAAHGAININHDISAEVLSHVALCECVSLEHEAQQAAQTIVDWVQQGKQRIAIVAQDRVVARRLRALLARAKIIVADETGWKLSTTRAAALLATWFDVVATRGDSVSLLDLLKSPFVPLPQVRSNDSSPNALTMPLSEVQSASEPLMEVAGQYEKIDLVMQIEARLKRENVLGGWEAMLSALEQNADKGAIDWLRGLAKHAKASSKPRRINEWCAQVRQMMNEFGWIALLEIDRAGAQVLQMLTAIEHDCAANPALLTFAEWRALVNLQMESTPYVVEKTDHRVVMLPLNGAHLRCFDAVFLVGADSNHLPSQARETLFFTNTVRRECGLVSQEERRCQQLRDVAELILSNPLVVLSWQSQKDDEHQPISPWLAQLNLQLERRGMPPLRRHLANLPSRHVELVAAKQPAPQAGVLAPKSLSASAYASLVACPYQFFARRMLSLSTPDELSDMPEKRDYGDWLHAILKTYHEQLKVEKIIDFAAKEKLLEEIANTLFTQVLAKTPAALGYQVRWTKLAPAYLAWAHQREEEGWQFEFGELWQERVLQWDDGEVILRGQIDRIDTNSRGEAPALALLDYKTKPLSALRTRLKKAEDHQLAFYGLLVGQTAHEAQSAHYVALEPEKKKTGDVAAEDFDQWQIELVKAIVHNLSAIKKDAPMPANGVESVCQYCDMRGLCRKGNW